MSDYYVQTCFAFSVTPKEASHILAAARLAEVLSGNPDDDILAAQWHCLTPDFHASFPPTGAEPWSGFRSLFPDPEYPSFGVTFEHATPPEATERVVVHGDQFDPDACAQLIAAIVTETLPVFATWSTSSSKYRLDEFSGGAFRIDKSGIHFISSHDIYSTRRFEPKLVLTTRTDEDGLLFWNNDAGFGPLAQASLYTQSEADALGTVITNDEPEWIALPDLNSANC